MPGLEPARVPDGQHGPGGQDVAGEGPAQEGGAHQRQVELPAAQLLQQLVGIGLVQFEGHPWVRPAEGGDPRPRRHFTDTADKAQAQCAAMGVAAVRHCLDCAPGHRQQALPPLIEDLPLLGQFQGVGAAAKERAAQFRLQQLHLLADGGLGHMEFPGGLVDAALLHHGDEVLDLL